MLPGDTYSPNELLMIVWRRKWWIIVPAIVCAAAAFVISRALPNRYRAETVILVVPQRVPEAYVRSTVTADIADRLQSISPLILSRTRLEKIIQDFGLYTEERRTQIMEDVVGRMRRDIEGPTVVKGDAFRVGYMGRDPRTVMRVTDRLASLFIEENLRDREQLAESTNQFLESQLEEARRRLIEQEKKLAAYQRQNAGTLPTQAVANLQVLQNVQMQVQSLTDSTNRDRDRKLAAERALADLHLPDTEPPSAPLQLSGTDPAIAAGRTLQGQLTSAQDALKELRLRLKPEHPDVIRMERAVSELQQRVELAVLATPATSSTGTIATPSFLKLAKANRIRELEAELQNLDIQIAGKQAEERRLRQAATEYQARVEAVPAREAEMAELTRDYSTLQNMYQSLLRKKEDSQISANLERRQVGQQFKLLDPAQLPEKPFSPNRLVLNLMGVGIGLGLGIALAALIEFRDSSFKTDAEVTKLLMLPVLARIPTMVTTEDRRRARRRQLALSTAVAVVVLLAGTGWKLGVLQELELQRRLLVLQRFLP